MHHRNRAELLALTLAVGGWGCNGFTSTHVRDGGTVELTVSDSSSLPDAAAAPDAAVPPDAAMPPDAAVPPDAALTTWDAAADAGSAVDGAAAGSDSALPDDDPPAPGAGLMHTFAQLQFIRAHQGEEPWQSAYQAVIAEAESSLGRAPAPRMDFDVPFYYDNPEAAEAAKQCLHEDARAAYALALGFQLAESVAKRNQYASKATEFLDGWAAVNRSVSGRDGVLVINYAGVPLLYAADLVANYAGWDAAHQAAFVNWVNAVFLSCADDIADNGNNWGDWGTLGMVAGLALQHDSAGVLFQAGRIRDRIADNIDANGELPAENNRTNSGMWYTFFAMTAMTTAVHIIRNTTGEDLFAYTAPNGRSIELALDREFYYCVHPEEWPYQLPDGLAGAAWRLLYPCDDEVEIPTPNSWPGYLFEAMSDIYQVPEWKDWVAPYRPQRGYRGWIYATLMRQTP